MSLQKQILTFSLTTNLNQPQNLPNCNQWRVHEDDILIAEKLPSYMKSKSFLGFRKNSAFKCRTIALTKKGFLIIYESECKGFVFNVKKATSTRTRTENGVSRRKKIRRCHVKLKYPFGSINIFIVSDQFSLWKQAFCGIHEGVICKTIASSTMTDESFAIYEANGEMSYSTFEPLSGLSEKKDLPVEKAIHSYNALTWVSTTESNVSDSSSSLTTVISKEDKPNIQSLSTSTNSGLFVCPLSTELDSIQSIRQGYRSVEMLRHKIEGRMKLQDASSCSLDSNITQNISEHSKRVPLPISKKSNNVQLYQSKSLPSLHITSVPIRSSISIKLSVPRYILHKENLISGYDNWDKSVRA